MMPADLPYIPENITVHLAEPDTPALNVTVSFADYIKNVASSENYPTWPENAIRANMLAQVSFALNRVYTEYYRSRGYSFDITNSTAFDQYFVNGRDIFENISRLADELFNNYVVRQGSVEPLFTQYCNGTTVTCAGLSQWGTVGLAEAGYTPYEILQYYFGDNININTDTPVRGITASLPYQALRLGNSGNDVISIQTRLNRISTNYPLIPKINPADGVFGVETEEAVRVFQRTFNLDVDGIVGKNTWYRIQLIYNAVKRLNELDSEGLTLDEVSKQYPEFLREGDSGNIVRMVQYLLDFVSQYEDTVNPVPLNGYYGQLTTDAVVNFQRTYGLVPDGILGEQTYAKLYDVYAGIVRNLPASMFVNIARPYPGIPLKLGMQDEFVSYLQEYINAIANDYPNILSPVTQSGVYGLDTRNAVVRLQELFGLPQTGITEALTWNAIANLYDDIRAGVHLNPGQFPGYTLTRAEI